MKLVSQLFLIVLAGPASAVATEAPAVSGPLYTEAVSEFTTMKTTLYQHKTEVDRAAGSFQYDCVEFVSYALKQAAPQAWTTVVKVTGLRPHRVPSPVTYQKFLAGLADRPQHAWQAVTKVADLRAGDVVSWDHKTTRASGHAVIIAGTPTKSSDGTWVVEVYDATSTPHAQDSRPKDPRAQVFSVTGRPSGLGHGIMAFTADPTTGALTGYRWTPKSAAVPCPIAAGRPEK